MDVNVSKELIEKTLEVYCEHNKSCIVSDNNVPGAGQRFVLMDGEDSAGNDIEVWCEEGKLKCSNPKFGIVFMEYLKDEEAKIGKVGSNKKEQDNTHLKAAEAAFTKTSKLPAKKSGGNRVPATIRKSQDIVEPQKQIQELTIEDIKDYICPNATDKEAFMFLKLCQARKLNPFLRQVYLIKYSKEEPAQMVVGKDAFTERAELHPQFDGFKAGIIVGTIEREGSCLLGKEDESLLGGWAEVYRKDRKYPFKITVSLKEYDKGKASWKDKPATMIRKVALVQALREAFPSEFSGMYSEEEMGGGDEGLMKNVEV